MSILLQCLAHICFKIKERYFIYEYDNYCLENTSSNYNIYWNFLVGTIYGYYKSIMIGIFF
jgi:hypothetical protein